jgi:DNA-binding MarR family transcriptional regulator
MASRPSSSDSFGTFLDTLRQLEGASRGTDFWSGLKSLQESVSNTAATSSLIRILAFLADNGKPASPSEVVQNTKVDVSAALSLLRDSEATGLIVSSDIPNGGKAFAITDAGREMLSLPR